MKTDNTAVSISLEGLDRWADILKFPVALCGTLGISVIVSDSVCSGYPFFYNFLFSLYWCMVFFLLLRPKKGTAAGGILLVAGMIGLHLILGNVENGQGAIRYLINGAISLWTLFQETIDSLGYVSLPTVTDPAYSVSNASAVCFTSFLSAAVLCPLSRKKTRLFAISIFTVLVLTPLFIYNLPSENLGISLIIAAIAAFTAMRISERRTGSTRTSGYSGIAALLVSSIILPIPAAAIGQPWRDEGGLSESIEYLREIMTRFAEGDTSFIESQYPTDHLNSRSTEPIKHNYTGKEVMKVFSDTDSEIYLRNWIGGSFDGKSWKAPENIVLFGKYTTELVTQKFIESISGDDSLSDFGMYFGEVKVIPKQRTKYLSVPTVMLNGPYTDQKTGECSFEYSTVGDGILMTKKNLSSRYAFSTESLIAARRTPHETARLHEYLDEHPELSLFGSYGTAFIDLSAIIRQQYGDCFSSPAIDAVLYDFLNTSEIGQRYFEFNASMYIDSTTAYPIVGLIVSAPSNVLYRRIGYSDSTVADDIATALADYLADNYVYSTSPRIGDSEDPISSFLLDTKEGYCVQFATALTLMMRRLGFSARYAEGYIANEFRTAKGNYAYSCSVTDRKAHAWTEVWIDGFGWMVYESTPGISNRGQDIGDDSTEVSDTDENSSVTSDSQPDISDSSQITDLGSIQTSIPSETTSSGGDIPSETNSTGGNERTGKGIGKILVAVLSVILLAIAVILLTKHSADRTKKRERIISMALEGSGNGGILCDQLFKVLSAYRIYPQKSELPSAFAKRAAEEFGNIAASALSAAERQLYGNGMTDRDKRAVGAFLKLLSDGAREKLGLFKFLWYRHILCVL